MKPVGTAAAMLLAAAALAAAEPPAPLEQTRQELKALRRDQATGRTETEQRRITDGLPQFDAPLPGAVAPPKPRTEREDNELKERRRREAQRNWLVNGVNRLDKESAGGARRGAPDPAKAAADEPEEEERPESLIELYEEKRREEGARQPNRPTTRSASDPLAPFLQDWMGTSPVRGKFFDEFVRKPESTRAASSVAAPEVRSDAPGLARDAFAGSSAPGGREPAAPNPYLQDLNPAPALPAAPPTWPAALPADAGAARSGPAWSPPPREDIRRNEPPPERRPPPSAQSENQKYFPQAKKF
ncbi:MAG: hypothetical protein JNG83_13295 [Opitutaceae bacterium]|nr:hypothetical protein [Opitutaceae bacterium]